MGKSKEMFIEERENQNGSPSSLAKRTILSGNVPATTHWENERLGNFTASSIYNLFVEAKTKEAKEKGELSEGAKTYVLEKLAELLTGQTRVTENIFAIQWGNEKEPMAIDLLKETYPKLTYYGVQDKKFFRLHRFSGGSPDGVDYDSKTVMEIKCPENTAIHARYMLFKKAEELLQAKKEYYYQIQMNMVCVAKEMGCKYDEMRGLFITYSPLPIEKKYRIKTLEVLPEPGFEEKLERAIFNANNYLNQLLSDLI